LAHLHKGDKVGLWTVKSERGPEHYVCKCRGCGLSYEVNIYSLERGRSNSCAQCQRVISMDKARAARKSRSGVVIRGRELTRREVATAIGRTYETTSKYIKEGVNFTKLVNRARVSGYAPIEDSEFLKYVRAEKKRIESGAHSMKRSS